MDNIANFRAYNFFFLKKSQINTASPDNVATIGTSLINITVVNTDTMYYKRRNGYGQECYGGPTS